MKNLKFSKAIEIEWTFGRKGVVTIDGEKFNGFVGFAPTYEELAFYLDEIPPTGEKCYQKDNSSDTSQMFSGYYFPEDTEIEIEWTEPPQPNMFAFCNIDYGVSDSTPEEFEDLTEFLVSGCVFDSSVRFVKLDSQKELNDYIAGEMKDIFDGSDKEDVSADFWCSSNNRYIVFNVNIKDTTKQHKKYWR